MIGPIPQSLRLRSLNQVDSLEGLKKTVRAAHAAAGLMHEYLRDWSSPNSRSRDFGSTDGGAYKVWRSPRARRDHYQDIHNSKLSKLCCSECDASSKGRYAPIRSDKSE
jgi:hypothetical protein